MSLTMLPETGMVICKQFMEHRVIQTNEDSNRTSLKILEDWFKLPFAGFDRQDVQTGLTES